MRFLKMVLVGLSFVAVVSCGDIHETRSHVVIVRPASRVQKRVVVTSTTVDRAAVRHWNETVLVNVLVKNAETARVSALRKHAGAPSIPPTTRPPVSAPSLEPCGGDLPPCYRAYSESRGSYSAYNPTGCGGRGCGGKWQFDPRTWNNFMGYPQAQLAPPSVQDERARQLWDGGRGCSHWAAC